MGMIVQFDARLSERSRPAPERPCEITIFPGVRYERHEPPAAPSAAGLSPAPRPRGEESAR